MPSTKAQTPLYVLAGLVETPHLKLRHHCTFCLIMIRLHYVPGGHGSHDFGHRGRNRVNVIQRRGTGSTNVARGRCRAPRTDFLTVKKLATAGLTYLNVAVVERGERNKT